ncbi:hypothetical protein GOODEAATRI_007338 [Goodea atripinnis]|uniref:Secreted protein n=1 Tax=Goodea atripinnis TaxID=208336 RepID=A0ABV0NI63_9TELE
MLATLIHLFFICSQPLWSTMAKSVLSRTWSWPLCCISVSGCWHSSYSLGHLYVEQQFFFLILREFFAMRCIVELPVTSMSECEGDNTKFNTPAPHSHLRPCNTKKSHDIRDGKWLIGDNLDIFT